MKSPTRYSFLIVLAVSAFTVAQLNAKPIGFSELSLLVRMHEPESSIKSEVAERRLLHPLTQPQENLLKQQGASDALIKSLHDANLVASKEEAAAVESAPARQTIASSIEVQNQKQSVDVFAVDFGHQIKYSNLVTSVYDVT